MKLYSFEHIAGYARENSPFYKELFKGLPGKITSVEEVPVIEQTAFWQANSSDLNENRVLTGKFTNGVAYKSGGTTGNPKYSVFTHDEFSTLTKLTGLGFMYNGMKDGDKVANIFYCGMMYGSFLYMHDSIRDCPVDVIEYPIMGGTPVPDIVHMISFFKINVLAGVPSTIVSVYEYAKEHGVDLSFVERIYFGGETFFEDQRNFVDTLSPGVQVRSACYALVDGGIGGYCDDTCGFNEHRVFDYAIILEIIDENTGGVIREPGVKGKLVVTSLYRKLMPMIRYPLGDYGQWVDGEGVANRRFKLLGRTEECARVGVVSMYYDDMKKVLNDVEGLEVLNYQFVVSHYDGKDKLTVKVAVAGDLPGEGMNGKCLESLYRERYLFKEKYMDGGLHETEFVFCRLDGLTFNPRTGKMKRIIDERL